MRWICGFAIVGFAVGSSFAENWPSWRGPRGDGTCLEANLPTKWGRVEGIRWKFGLPQAGNSSPIVWGNQVFVTCSLDAKGHKRGLFCLDRKNGQLIWKREIEYRDDETTHQTNPYCSATPVTDGERVIASFGSAGLVCCDVAGNVQWRFDTGRQDHIFGNASSPILSGDFCILWCGPGTRQFLVAVDKRTGKKMWQHDELGGERGDPTSVQWIGSWSTPIIISVEGHKELVLCAPRRALGFDPVTGRKLWWVDGLDDQAYTTPVLGPEGNLLMFSGFNGPDVAVKPGGKGDVTKTHVVWQKPKAKAERGLIGSPVISGKYCFVVTASSRTAACFESKTGDAIWTERMPPGGSWSSAVAGNGRVYALMTDGTCFVFSASPKFEQIAANRLDEETKASLAISEGDIFIRTDQHLWCISDRK
jgi:outer membrane protein assembly factor BamB